MLKINNRPSNFSRLRLLIGVMLLTFFSSSFSSTPVYIVIPEKEGNAIEATNEWEKQIYQAMEKEDLPVFWVKSGNIDLMAEVADRFEQNLEALYRLAVSCRYSPYKQWCDEHDIIMRLRDADPENVVVYFTDGPNFNNIDGSLEGLEVLVTQENIERLKLASEASYVYRYYGGEASKWRELVRKHVGENPPPIEATLILREYYKAGIPESTIRSYYYPAERLAWKNFRNDGINNLLENIVELCVAMAAAKHIEGIEYCRIVAKLLLNESQEHKHQALGHQIEYYYHSIINSDDPDKVWQKIRFSQEAEHVELRCSKPLWFSGDRIPLGGWEELDAFYKDLSQFGLAVSLSRAQKRELTSAGLKQVGVEPEDPCGYSVLHEKYRLLHEQISTSMLSY
ncbi:MAG: hypothetical protein L3J22_07425 [Xanthomonadales bacterium]|nr:hypothetical protein [Xanthomonadales bacterium]